MAVGACVTNIIGNSILVPQIGCQGAAISTGISYIVFYLLRTLLGMRYYYVDFKVTRFCMLTMIVSFYAFYNTFNPFSIFSILGYFICLIAIIFLYRKTVIWMLQYGVDFIKSCTRKKVWVDEWIKEIFMAKENDEN